MEINLPDSLAASLFRVTDAIAASGMSEQEVYDLFENELKAMRAEKRQSEQAA